MKPFERAVSPSAWAALTVLSSMALSACITMPGSTASSSSGSTTASAPAPAPAPATAAPAPAATTAKVGPGMNARGEVVDSSKVEGGYGQKIKGLNDWEGEITGKPGPGSKFVNLKIGMGMKQSTDIAGQPSDQGAYLTGKSFIPWYFGSDRHRYEMVFKGQGRLVFAGSGGFDMGAGNLIWIIHNPNEAGYR